MAPDPDKTTTDLPPLAEIAKWGDLNARLLSSAGMVVVGTAAVIAGGVWFQMLAVFAASVMIWELWQMIEPKSHVRGMLLAALAASVFSGFLTVERAWFVVFLPVVPLLGLAMISRERLTWAFFSTTILVAGWGLVMFRGDYGFTWILWLILVVIATDVAGYFVGKAIGGPKFWPRISPKKTWSGTVGGWIAAGLVGALFWGLTNAGPWVIPLSMCLSFAGQMGDIAESALKRRMGVKDSSHLIPGHGGLFDRFDALLGASLFMLFVVAAFDVPGLAF